MTQNYSCAATDTALPSWSEYPLTEEQLDVIFSKAVINLESLLDVAAKGSEFLLDPTFPLGAHTNPPNQLSCINSVSTQRSVDYVDLPCCAVGTFKSLAHADPL